jgi:hypothetical protein
MGRGRFNQKKQELERRSTLAHSSRYGQDPNYETFFFCRFHRLTEKGLPKNLMDGHTLIENKRD